ncbi:MAG: hypothetical protein QNJ41_09105 [Xenococcaceae cyanobacterium MO_188.B32]|nr:hypothetical protein [Xenococcaceae cyanobacterium MO_188.B32]
MKKHYVLSINSQAEHDWDKCIIRNPITGERPDLKSAIAQAIGNQPGSYLVSVQIEVEVLEKVALSSVANGTLELGGSTKENKQVNLPQIIASRS